MMRAHAHATARPAAEAPQAKPAIQRKARLGGESDPLEREADRAAATVLSGGNVVALSRGGARLQRKCAHCEEEEKRTVRRKCARCEAEEKTMRRKGAGPVAQQHIDAAAAAVSSGGAPLTSAQRAYFEPRFGQDFSAVRLHTDAPAERAAERIGARAYAYGSSIAFAAGERSDGLLAHELAHVAQQSGGVIRRQPAPAPALPDRTFIDESGGGTTRFRETVVGAPALQPDGTFTGRVRRRVLAPAAGGRPQQQMRSGTVNVVFDPNNCLVRVPFAMNFVAAAASGRRGICDDSPAAPAPSAGRVAAIAREAVETVREGLNDWYAVRIEGCQHPCAGRDIPIRVDVSQSAANPDATVNVVNRSGDANASTICAPDFNPGTTVHESGHQALELIDEYRERRARVRRASPVRSRNERVRSDFSYMASHHTYGRLAVFHERHFRFAQVFVEAVLANPACTISLTRTRSLPRERRLSVHFGGLRSGEGDLPVLGLGLDWALPFTATRRLNFEAGLRAQWVLTPPEQRDALLLGVRLGLSAQTNPARTGVSAGLFAGGGATVLPSLGLYGEVGGRVGLSSPMNRGRRFGLELEGALGRIVGDDAEALRYSRLGLNLVFSF